MSDSERRQLVEAILSDPHGVGNALLAAQVILALNRYDRDRLPAAELTSHRYLCNVGSTNQKETVAMTQLETAREFGAATFKDGQGTFDSETGPSVREILDSVREHTPGGYSDAAILSQWSLGYNVAKQDDLIEKNPPLGNWRQRATITVTIPQYMEADHVTAMRVRLTQVITREYGIECSVEVTS